MSSCFILHLPRSEFWICRTVFWCCQFYYVLFLDVNLTTNSWKVWKYTVNIEYQTEENRVMTTETGFLELKIWLICLPTFVLWFCHRQFPNLLLNNYKYHLPSNCAHFQLYDAKIDVLSTQLFVATTKYGSANLKFWSGQMQNSYSLRCMAGVILASFFVVQIILNIWRSIQNVHCSLLSLHYEYF